MKQHRFRRVLQPLRKLLDQYQVAPTDRVDRPLESVRYPDYRWDLGTLIAVFPPESPWYLLDLNWVLGAMGNSFDLVSTRSRRAGMDAFDLQFCLEGKERHATYKAVHSVAEEVSFITGAVNLTLRNRLKVTGTWPEYRIEYRQPERSLELDLQYRAWPGIHWWARSPGLYSHFSNFGSCDVTWRWNGDQGHLQLPALLEHAWGNHLLPFRIPLGIFRYEVLRMPENGIAISLWVDAPGGLEMATAAVQRFGAETERIVGAYQCEVLEWETLPNRAGDLRRLPIRWRGVQQFDEGTFKYETERITPPRPIMGDGFLHTFAWRGEGTGVIGGSAEGTGYVEQMGRP